MKRIEKVLYSLSAVLFCGCSYPLFPELDAETSEMPSLRACSDGIDNDDNGLVDCEEPACSIYRICDSIEKRLALCTDGIDNDENALVDCEDPYCRTQGILCPKSGDGCFENEIYVEHADGLSGCYTPITRAEDLRFLRGRPKDRFILQADIDLSDEAFQPIGFHGILLGNGHQLYGELTFAADASAESRACSLFRPVREDPMPASALSISDLDLDLVLHCDRQNEAYLYAGGILSEAQAPAVFQNITGNVSLVITQSQAGAPPLKELAIGGLVGQSGGSLTIQNSALTTQITLTHTGSVPLRSFVGGILGYGSATLESITLGHTLDCRGTGNRDDFIEADYRMYFGGLVGQMAGGRIQNIHINPEREIQLHYPIHNYSSARSFRLASGGLAGEIHDGTVSAVFIEGGSHGVTTNLGVLNMPDPAQIAIGGGIGETDRVLDQFYVTDHRIEYTHSFRQPLSVAVGGISGKQVTASNTLNRNLRFTGQIVTAARTTADAKSRMDTGGLVGYGATRFDTAIVDADISVTSTHAPITRTGGVMGCYETDANEDLLLLNNIYATSRFSRLLDASQDAIHTYPYAWGGLVGTIQDSGGLPKTNIYLSNSHARTHYHAQSFPDRSPVSSHDIILAGCVGNPGGRMTNIFTSTKVDDQDGGLQDPFFAVGGGLVDKDTYYDMAYFDKDKPENLVSPTAEGYTLTSGEPRTPSGESVLMRIQKSALMGAVTLHPLLLEGQRCNTWKLSTIDGVTLPVPELLEME